MSARPTIVSPHRTNGSRITVTSASAVKTDLGVRRGTGDEHRQPPGGVQRAPDQQNVRADHPDRLRPGHQRHCQPDDPAPDQLIAEPEGGERRRRRADRPVGDPVVPGPRQPQSRDRRQRQQAGVQNGHRVRHRGHLGGHFAPPATRVHRPRIPLWNAAELLLDRRAAARSTGAPDRTSRSPAPAPHRRWRPAPGTPGSTGRHSVSARKLPETSTAAARANWAPSPPACSEPQGRPRAAAPTSQTHSRTVAGRETEQQRRRAGRTETSAGRAGGTRPGPGPGPSVRPPVRAERARGAQPLNPLM